MSTQDEGEDGYHSNSGDVGLAIAATRASHGRAAVRLTVAS
jgi:hypothetical protein